MGNYHKDVINFGSEEANRMALVRPREPRITSAEFICDNAMLYLLIKGDVPNGVLKLRIRMEEADVVCESWYEIKHG
jgi:hypothetical protein